MPISISRKYLVVRNELQMNLSEIFFLLELQINLSEIFFLPLICKIVSWRGASAPPFPHATC